MYSREGLVMKEIYSINHKQTSINISGSKIESVREKNILKTGLRIYKDGFIGVSGAIGKFDADELSKRANSALKAKVEYPYEITSNIKKDVIINNEIFKDNDFINEIEEVLDYLRKNQSSFIFSNKINMSTVDTSLKNEENLNLNYKDSAITVELVFKEKSSSNIMDGAIVFEDRKYNKNDFISISDDFLNAYKNNVEFKKEGKYPVVFASIDDTPFIKFISDLNGRVFGTGSSLFSKNLGKKIFNDSFTLYNSLSPEDICLQPFFDAEGTINKDYRFPLIENGVLKAANTDKKTAAMFNLPLTGSAVCDYDSIPQPGISKLKVKECEKTAKELLGGDMGIFVADAAGGDFTPDGNFATPVQLAFLYDGEKIIGRLPELQISSNIFEMYGNSFRGVSKNDIWPLGNIKAMIMDMDVKKL
jgi:PmbA protein